MDYWTELLEWTTFFALKIIFMAYNKIPLPVKLSLTCITLDQSVIVSIPLTYCTEPHMYKIR